MEQNGQNRTERKGAEQKQHTRNRTLKNRKGQKENQKQNMKQKPIRKPKQDPKQTPKQNGTERNRPDKKSKNTTEQVGR